MLLSGLSTMYFWASSAELYQLPWTLLINLTDDLEFSNISQLYLHYLIKYEKIIITLHPEKLASKKFGYLACDR